MMLNTLSLVLAVLNIIQGGFWICSANPNIPPIAKYFGTKSRYEDVNTYLPDSIRMDESNGTRPSPECEAVHITAILRHGTRYPSRNYINPMNEIHKLVKTKPSEDWKISYDERMDGSLAEKGKKDHRDLAVRLAKSFPKLISKENFLTRRFKFNTSSIPRCRDSIKAFYEGLVEYWELGSMSPEVGQNDDLMRYFSVCKDEIKSENPPNEKKLFSTLQEMRRVKANVARRLGVKSEISADLVEAAFLLCAYDFAIRDKNSPWCGLFNEEDAKVLEYSNDLAQYRKSHIYRKSSCSLLLDLFSRLDRVSSASSQVTEAVTVQMGHAETLMPLLTLLGFFDGGEPLKADNYASQHDRKFTSRVMPYAANMVFVLYKCSSGHRLQFLLNENCVKLPNISEDAPLFSKVKEVYKNQMNECIARKKEC